MAECRIAQCKCVSEQQDKLYGKHMRVWNPIGKNNQSNGFRCTVCGAETKSNIPITPKIKWNESSIKSHFKISKSYNSKKKLAYYCNIIYYI